MAQLTRLSRRDRIVPSDVCAALDISARSCKGRINVSRTVRRRDSEHPSSRASESAMKFDLRMAVATDSVVVYLASATLRILSVRQCV